MTRRCWTPLLVLLLLWPGPADPALALAQPADNSTDSAARDAFDGPEDDAEDLWNFDDAEEDVETLAT